MCEQGRQPLPFPWCSGPGAGRQGVLEADWWGKHCEGAVGTLFFSEVRR